MKVYCEAVGGKINCLNYFYNNHNLLANFLGKDSSLKKLCVNYGCYSN